MIGGSGAGKTHSVILPNIINHPDANLVITDTKGELYRATARGLREDGYEVVRLDTVDLDSSCLFNPLAYIECEDDIPVVARQLLFGINPNREVSSDQFWPNSVAALMFALVGILFEFERRDGALSPFGEERLARRDMKYLNVPNVLRLLDLLKIEDAETAGAKILSPLDHIVDNIATGRTVDFESGCIEEIEPRPNCYAVRQYYGFRDGAPVTMRCVVMELQQELSRLKGAGIQRVLSGDELRLDAIDEGKRAVFLVMSDNDDSNAFLGNIAFKMLLSRALQKADQRPDGRLVRRVMFVCDEFANLGPIPGFERAVSIVRSRGMSFVVCAQSISQLDHVYGANVREIILDNCDSLIYLGSGSSPNTAAYISSLCGAPVGADGRRARGVGRSAVVTPAEVACLPRDSCIVRISGARPFLTRKYDVHEHPNAQRFLDLR